ncbi:MAG: cadherin-like beta sandwich domain-containing protein, partial [Gammaproteobacteria bacterium]|nr:cadherin-like beta sandwich domain-containing protein [Gammaproteobacteria bacterium]
MYVADANDGRVYTYNMPDTWDARLASLALSGVDFEEFEPGRTEYEGVPDEGISQTTVSAAPAQEAATVDIAPPDADGDADGHQVDLAGAAEITVTVTSPDGSRVRVYTVALAGGAPPASCLSGDVSVGFSLLIYEGGSLEELESCAESRHVNALYALEGGEFVPYVLGAPGIVNRPFRELFPEGVPELTPLTVRSEGPASDDPGARPVAGPWESCLRGETSRGLSHVLYEGGGVGDLAACAEGLGVTALYALEGGEFVPYILGAPGFVNSAFRELFAEGVAAGAPLVARGE